MTTTGHRLAIPWTECKVVGRGISSQRSQKLQLNPKNSFFSLFKNTYLALQYRQILGKEYKRQLCNTGSKERICNHRLPNLLFTQLLFYTKLAART